MLITYKLAHHTVVGQRQSQYAGVTVVQRTHCIICMCRACKAFVHTDFRFFIDRICMTHGKLNTKLSVIGWILSADMLIISIIMSSMRGGNIFALAAVPFALALLFGLGSMIYAMLASNAAQESEEKELLSRRRAESRALDVDEDVRFTAGRTFANFLRFAPFVLALLAAALAAGCIGFLVWNFYPAKVFMGDTGSLFLGGMLVAIAFGLGLPIFLVPVGIVFIIEVLSVIIQTTYFKLTHGKRIFKMSPIHHHFEMCGRTEVQIVVMFSAAGAVGGALAVLAAAML